MRDSTLTTAMREYLRGEKDVSDSYGRRLINDIRERLAIGLTDLSLAAEHIDQIDAEKVLMKYKPGKPADGDPTNGRSGWRQQDVRESIIGSLTFLMEISRAFDYYSESWQEWIEQAIYDVRDVDYVSVQITTFDDAYLDHWEEMYGEGDPTKIGREIAWALYDTNRITAAQFLDTVPDRLVDFLRDSMYEAADVEPSEVPEVDENRILADVFSPRSDDLTDMTADQRRMVQKFQEGVSPERLRDEYGLDFGSAILDTSDETNTTPDDSKKGG